MSWLPRKTVVTPIDFQDESFEACDLALELAADPASVHVVHVLPRLSPMEPGVTWGELTDDVRTEKTEQAIRDRLSDARYAQVQIHVAVGSAAKEITKHAEHVDADLIVLPSHGRTGGARLLLGSVAEHVARLAHCPVLILRS